MARIRRLTGGRTWAARLLVLLPVIALVGMTLAVLPALASHEPAGSLTGESVQGVPLDVTKHVGGNAVADCRDIDPAYNMFAYTPNPAQTSGQELIVTDDTGIPIENSLGGQLRVVITSPSPSGSPALNGQTLDYHLINTTGSDIRVAVVVVKGAKDSSEYDNIGAGFPGTSGIDDQELQAPFKNNGQIQNLSHASVCLAEFVEINCDEVNDLDGYAVRPTCKPGVASILAQFTRGVDFVQLHIIDAGVGGADFLLLERSDFFAVPEGTGPGEYPFTVEYDDTFPYGDADVSAAPQCPFSPDSEPDLELDAGIDFTLLFPGADTTCYYWIELDLLGPGDVGFINDGIRRYDVQLYTANIGDGWRKMG